MRFLKFFMFNRLVRLYLDSNSWFLQLNKRAKSLILEMWCTLSVFFPYLGVLMFFEMTFGDPLTGNFKWIDLLTLIPFSLMMMALFNKDFFGGQSVVHRQLGYKVIDAKTNQTASPVQCLVRNLTGPIWPIEAIFILVSPKRRFGDIIAGTILIEVPPSDPELILREMKEFKFDSRTQLTLFASIICVGIFMLLFDPRVKLW